ncbi:hypothetical protein ABT186_01040 [Streptomyces sp. NPDC001634]|uniref:hypothetical protein n=1 Tax=Streptomyces sp. NPDC001634 TaxID=3154390 RepID=UPI00332CEE8D
MDESTGRDADRAEASGGGMEPYEDEAGAPDVLRSGGPDRDRLIPPAETDRLVLALVVLAVIVLLLIVVLANLDMNTGGGSGLDPNTVWR